MTPLPVTLAERLNLRYPVLVIALAIVTILDFVIPDVIPLVDEVGLLLLTLLVSRWKARRDPAPPAARSTADTPRSIESGHGRDALE